VGGLVYTSPALGDEKPDGRLRLTAMDDDAVERLAQVLAGPSTPATN
jgi:hypothetical protein